MGEKCLEDIAYLQQTRLDDQVDGIKKDMNELRFVEIAKVVQVVHTLAKELGVIRDDIASVDLSLLAVLPQEIDLMRTMYQEMQQLRVEVRSMRPVIASDVPSPRSVSFRDFAQSK